jgi:hypothetical protein
MKNLGSTAALEDTDYKCINAWFAISDKFFLTIYDPYHYKKSSFEQKNYILWG